MKLLPYLALFIGFGLVGLQMYDPVSVEMLRAAVMGWLR